jgi:hypothetical protein
MSPMHPSLHQSDGATAVTMAWLVRHSRTLIHVDTHRVSLHFCVSLKLPKLELQHLVILNVDRKKTDRKK